MALRNAKEKERTTVILHLNLKKEMNVTVDKCMVNMVDLYQANVTYLVAKRRLNFVVVS